MVAPKNNVKENKPKMSELPLDVLGKMLCPAYAEGTDKYYRNSWREGFKTSDMMDALLRHLDKFYYQREDYDPECPKKSHLGAAMFCLIAMYHSWENYPELDDRPGEKKKKKIKSRLARMLSLTKYSLKKLTLWK